MLRQLLLAVRLLVSSTHAFSGLVYRLLTTPPKPFTDFLPLGPPASAGKMSLVSSVELGELRLNNNVLREQNLAFAQVNANLTHRAQELDDQLTTKQSELDQGRYSSPTAVATPASATAIARFTPAALIAAPSPASHQASYSPQAVEMAMAALEDELKQAKEDLEKMTGERTLVSPAIHLTLSTYVF